MTSALPQHSLDAFNRFELDIYQIISNYPNGTLINPSPLSHATYVSRIRDAINSMQLNGWESDRFTLSQASRVFRCLGAKGTFVFTYSTGDLIYCGAPTPVAHRGVIKPVDVVLALSHGELDARDELVFNSIFELKRRDLITSAVTFKNVSAEQLARINNEINLELIEEAGAYILI